VFFAHYSRLLEWATQITRNDRAEAEDLVHDLYFRITRINRPIDQIERIEQYLFKVLRNLYYARQRRAGHDPISDLSIVDYDSVEQGLAVADRRELLFVYDNLRQICRYACQRKSEVRSASVLILRFFHGYYPSELMKILQVGRSGVDKFLRVARNEVRLYLERPNSIRSIFPGVKPLVSFVPRERDTQLLFSELQEAIFSAVEGKHLDRAILERRYAGESETTGTATEELSHLVSCRTCLEMVNSILRLPSLADRSPEDGTDRDGPGNSGGTSITPFRKMASQKPSKRKLERRLRDLHEHRPSRLQIVVDGDVRTSQRITAELNELHLKLARKEQPLFVEILSEQRFCLAFLLVGDPDDFGELKQVETVSLSDDRTLTLTISFAADGPIIHVLYRDPVMCETGGLEISGESDNYPVLSKPSLISDEVAHRSERWLQRNAGNLSAWLRRRYRGLFINMNFLLTSAALLTLGACICLLLWYKTAPPMSPNAFLQRADAADQVAVSAGQPKVISQKIRIRTASQTIERVIHRDTRGRRKPKPQPLDPQAVVLQAKLAEAGVKWDEPLSIATYEDWRARSRISHDSVRKTNDTLLTLTTEIIDGDVKEESLTVRVADFHPVARTISFRDSGNVEIAELDYSVLPWNEADGSWFEPISKAAVSDAPRMHTAIHLPHALSDFELDEAELAARTSLNQLHADVGEQIRLVRSSAGIDIKGVVDTDVRKKDLLEHLAFIPNVHASILSAEEIGMRPLSRSGSASQQVANVYSVQAQSSPLEQYLHDKSLPIDRLAPISDGLVDGSDRVVQAGTHLSELQSRFGETSQLSANEQVQVELLSRNYIETITTGISANQQILLSLEVARPSSVPKNFQGDDSEQGIDEQLRRYRQLCLEMVSNETGQGRPAPEIAREILDVGERIRLRLTNISPTARKDNN
jgi:DNA-directed RNA polymerase specialized sigma24 family protein